MTVRGDSSSATSGSCTASRILLANELGREIVRFRVEQQIAERAEKLQPAVLPACLEHTLALVVVGHAREGLVAGLTRPERNHRLAVALAQPA